MDSTTFEQSAVNLDVFGDKQVFVSENSDVTVNFFNGTAITGTLACMNVGRGCPHVVLWPLLQRHRAPVQGPS